MFDPALSAIMGALGVAAVYWPPDGEPSVSCTVMWTRGDATFTGYGAGSTIPAHVVDVRAAEVADPVEGATLVISEETYRIARRSRPDADRLLWRLELVKEEDPD